MNSKCESKDLFQTIQYLLYLPTTEEFEALLSEASNESR